MKYEANSEVSELSDRLRESLGTSQASRAPHSRSSLGPASGTLGHGCCAVSAPWPCCCLQHTAASACSPQMSAQRPDPPEAHSCNLRVKFGAMQAACQGACVVIQQLTRHPQGPCPLMLPSLEAQQHSCAAQVPAETLPRRHARKHVRLKLLSL